MEAERGPIQKISQPNLYRGTSKRSKHQGANNRDVFPISLPEIAEAVHGIQLLLIHPTTTLVWIKAMTADAAIVTASAMRKSNKIWS